jgi:hypothetical protein
MVLAVPFDEISSAQVHQGDVLRVFAQVLVEVVVVELHHAGKGNT